MDRADHWMDAATPGLYATPPQLPVPAAMHASSAALSVACWEMASAAIIVLAWPAPKQLKSLSGGGACGGVGGDGGGATPMQTLGLTWSHERANHRALDCSTCTQSLPSVLLLGSLVPQFS